MSKSSKPPSQTPTGRTPRAELTKRIARIANTQGGTIGGTQLCELPMSREAIRRRVASGSLFDLGGDVYAVGHRVLGERGWHHAALLAAGPKSALSYWTAAIIWRLTDRKPGRVEASTPNRSTRRACQSVDIHRPRSLTGSDVTSQDGRRVTTIFRTLLDLASSVDDAELRRMVEMAFTKHHVSPIALSAYARGRRRQAGAGRLAAAAIAVSGPVTIRSTLEATFRSFCEERGLPQYEANVPFERWELDGFWRHHGVAVELDFYTWHGARSNYRIDRKKGLAIARAGIHLLRIAGEDLDEDPDDVYETVLAVLARYPRE